VGIGSIGESRDLGLVELKESKELNLPNYAKDVEEKRIGKKDDRITEKKVRRFE
jgi:hypothetical protein